MKKVNYFKELSSKIKKKQVKVGVIGIGYVGIQLLIQFNKNKIRTIGFDIDERKISKLKKGISPYSYIKNANIKPLIKYSTYSNKYNQLSLCDIIIICLPTPIKKNTRPDLSAIEITLNKIKKYFKKGQLIILESTTYPGTTREKIASKLNNFNIGKNIFLSYSPEREDPGRKIPYRKVTKISSGYSKNCSLLSKTIYEKIVNTVIVANSLEEAEMTKLLENIYRSVNIGLVNELKMICKAMGTDINNIIKLASTKPFGFKSFYPGPGIGGHCIPIDPYYLYWRAKEFNQEAKFIKVAGDINIETTDWTIKNIIKIINQKAKSNRNKKILILGLSYKKNIEDLRESAAIKIINSLKAKNFLVDFSDPHIDPKDENVKKLGKYTKSIDINIKNLKKYDCVVLVTDHDKFNYKLITKYSKILIDTRNKIYRKKNFFSL